MLALQQMRCNEWITPDNMISPLIAECSGVMARLAWARNQPMVSRYIIACLAGDMKLKIEQTLFHPFSLVDARDEKMPSFLTTRCC